MDSKAPTDAAQNEQVGENLAQALLQVNKLLYKTPPSLSVATSRRMVSAYPQQRTYGDGETLVFSFPTGSQFIDMKNSFLKLRLSVPSGQCSLGRGSIANLFSEIRVKSRSGTELSRLQGFNAFTSMKDRWTNARDAFRSDMLAQGYGNTQLSATGAAADDTTNTVLATTGADYILPLSSIPCFDPIGNCLLPPQMMDGCIIEMDLDSPAIALKAQTGVVPPSYTVSLLEFRLCAFTLGDAFQRKISQLSAQNGLSISFFENYRTLVSQASGNNTFNYDVKKAASQAVAAYILPRTSEVCSAATAALLDSMESEPLSVVRLQMNVGPVYYPNSPLEIAGLAADSFVPYSRASELYRYVNQAWKSGNNKTTGVSYSSFVNPSGAGDNVHDATMGSLAVSFIRSGVSGSSGIMINSSRTCVIDVEFNKDVARRLDTWLCFVRNVKVYLSNQVVSD